MNQFNALSTKCHITVRFTGHSRTVGPKCGTCLGTSCQHIPFVGGFWIFTKFVYPCQLGSKKLKILKVNTSNNRNKHKFFLSDKINQCLCYDVEDIIRFDIFNCNW